jgi:hypothetical protein
MTTVQGRRGLALSILIRRAAIRVQKISQSRGERHLTMYDRPSHSIAATFLLDPYYVTHPVTKCGQPAALPILT